MGAEPEINPGGETERTGTRVRRLGVLFVFSFSLAILYQGMRGVMYLGGFVATGGPYLVTHQAPGWVYAMPPAIFLVVAGMSAGFVQLKKKRGFNLMTFSWPAIFISLGWNFLDFGLGLQGKPGPYWDDVGAAILFILIGSIPLAVMLLDLPRTMKERRDAGAAPSGYPWTVLSQIALAAAAVFLGVLAFRGLQ
jgi:hypothetical protein